MTTEGADLRLSAAISVENVESIEIPIEDRIVRAIHDVIGESASADVRTLIWRRVRGPVITVTCFQARDALVFDIVRPMPRSAYDQSVRTLDLRAK